MICYKHNSSKVINAIEDKLKKNIIYTEEEHREKYIITEVMTKNILIWIKDPYKNPNRDKKKNKFWSHEN